MLVLIGLFSILFTTFAVMRFNAAITLFLFLLPTYVIRFSVGSIPSTLLEVMLLILLVVWLFREGPRISYYILQVARQERLLTGSVLLFILAATISITTGNNLQTALGEWKAFYIEPILFFLMLVTSIKTKKGLVMILSGLVFSGLVTSLLAVFQHWTGWMVPYDFWEKGESFRVTAWYGFPNGVGLFIAPLIPLAGFLIQDRFTQLSQRKKETTDVLFLLACSLFLITGPMALFFAKSTGALVGLAAGIVFLLFMNKPTRVATSILSLLGLLSLFLIPQLQPIQEEILLQDRSGQIRLAIWSESLELLAESPIIGAGLASYAEKIEPYHKTVNGEGIEIFHHPHNIFLTMWVNLGLLGLVSFVLLLFWFFKKGLRSNDKGLPSLVFVVISMVVLLVHGLVDSPYIKNDLSILFWVLPSLLFLVDSTKSQMEI